MAKKRKASPALKKITARAKQLYKGNRCTWSSAIKQASREYNAGKLGAVKFIEKGEKKSTPAKKVYRVSRSAKGRYKGTSRVSGVVKTRHSVGATANPPKDNSRWPPRLQMVNGIRTGSVGAMKQAIKGEAKAKLANALLRRDLAKTKRDKRKIGKQVVLYRKEVKKYS